MRKTKRQWKNDADFKPWQNDQRRAVGLLSAAAACMGIAILVPFGVWTAVCLIGALVTGIAGKKALRSANNRAFGKMLEAESIATLVPLLPGNWRVFTNQRLPGLGDVDLWLIRPDDRRVVIEIKSFRRWNTHLFGLLPGDREASAIAQSERIVERLEAHAGLVWLPQGRPTFWQWLLPPRKGKTKVVFGSARRMRQSIRRA